MKRAMLITVFALGAALPVRAQHSAPLPPAESNAAVVRAVFDGAWSAGSFDGLDRLLAPDMKFHYRGSSRAMTPAQFQRMVGNWRSALPDLRFQLEDVVSSGDLVAARMIFTGTHQGQLMDLAPTGKSVKVEMMGFFRLANGRITDMWEVFDETGMRAQLAPPKQ